MASKDRMIKRRPIKPGPVKPQPKGKLPKRGPGKSIDPGFLPKKGPQLPKPGKPVKPTPKGGGIRDLLYKVKPGEKMQKLKKSYESALSKPRGKKPMPVTGPMIKAPKRNPISDMVKPGFMQKFNPADVQKGRKTKPVMPRRGGR